MIYSLRKKIKENKPVVNPNIGYLILAIDILIIMGMFIYARHYFIKPKESLYAFNNIEYSLQAKLLANKQDYLLELKMRNKGREPKLLKFTEPQYDFIIKKYEKIIWHTSGTSQKEVLLQPDGNLYLSQIWNQRNKWGEMVEPGDYQVVCRINYESPINIDTYIKVKER